MRWPVQGALAQCLTHSRCSRGGSFFVPPWPNDVLRSSVPGGTLMPPRAPGQLGALAGDRGEERT